MYTHRYYNSTKEGVEYIKMQFGKNLITKNIYENFSDEQIKKEYCKLNKNKENIEKIISLIITSIKKIYDYSITLDDLNYLNKFINNISLDITNTEAFYAFLIFSVIKNINNEQIHVLFLNDLLAQKTYTQSNKLYEFLEIKASLNIIPDDSSLTKKDIFKSNIIFSDWKQIVWEHLNTINIEKIANRPIIKYDCAFIFDIDIIIYDCEKYTLEADLQGFNPKKIKVKKFFKNYKNITGVSTCLAFENKKIQKNYQLKTEILSNPSKIYDRIKNSNEYFYIDKSEKNKHIARQIAELHKNNETIIVDVDDKEDLEFLQNYLTLKNIKISTIDNSTDINDINYLTIVIPNKVTLITDQLTQSIESKPGGDWEEIAKVNSNLTNTNPDSNFYKEKLKKELKKQNEIHKKNIEKINTNGGINIIFASHYSELKYEYAVIKNYSNIKIKDISFYNCAQDELYKELKLSKINLFNKKNTEENKILFNTFSKLMFYLKKYIINKNIRQNKGKLYFNVINKEI